MRVVDFFTFPDRAEHRSALLEAAESIDLDGGELTDPVDDAAAAGIGLPADFDDEEVRQHAEEIRAQLAAAVGDGATVRFEIADAESDTAGGSPDHLE